MSKIALAAAVMALTIAPLAIGHAQAPSPARFVPPPGAAPPWADTTTTTETPQAPTPTVPPTPTATSAPVSTAALPQTDASSTATPGAAVVTPMQGTTTPIHIVSLRAGPSGNAPIIGTLHPGDQLQILATANYGWTQVQSPAGTGWAYGSYLAQGGTASIVQPPAPQPEVISR